MAIPVNFDCKEPWLYWWLLLPVNEKKVFKRKYFPESHPHFTVTLLDVEKQIVWENEKPEPLGDLEWMLLATNTVDVPRLPASQAEQDEIWRQVYRIASEKM